MSRRRTDQNKQNKEILELLNQAHESMRDSITETKRDREAGNPQPDTGGGYHS